MLFRINLYYTQLFNVATTSIVKIESKLNDFFFIDIVILCTREEENYVKRLYYIYVTCEQRRQRGVDNIAIISNTWYPFLNR